MTMFTCWPRGPTFCSTTAKLPTSSSDAESWRAASPSEIESEILEPQEEVLQGLNGLERIDGNANAGGANVNLTFAVGTDMRDALVLVRGATHLEARLLAVQRLDDGERNATRRRGELTW